MKLLQQPNRWSCTLSAFCMVMDMTHERVIALLGHDGSDIIWPSQPEPLCRRGFHIEELQYIAFHCGKVLVPFVPAFMYSPSVTETPMKFLFDTEFHKQVESCNGILLGHTKGQRNGHAVAWNAEERMIYDPAGRISGIDAFEIEYFYALVGYRARII